MKKKEYIIQSKYEAVGELCAQVSSFCDEITGNKELCREIEICLVEALNNIIRHAYKEDFSQKIWISIELDQKSVRIEMKDTGSSRKEFRKPKLEFDPDDIDNLPEGGMGLYIIDQLMDEITYRTEDQVNVFTLKKYIK